MKINSVHAVFFSPCGSTGEITKQIADEIAGAAGVSVTVDDFTLPSSREHARKYKSDELVVFGVPTYAGRIPNKALPFVQELFSGEDTPAVAAVTFGNRSYDNSLNELRVELEKHGFIPVALGAFVSRHVMSETLGNGRPDAADTDLLHKLAKGAADIVVESEDAAALRKSVKLPEAVEVGPYYRPLEEDGKPADFLKAKPLTDEALCDKCGICAEKCPMGSIDKDDVFSVPGICIKCHACIRKCPVHAKYFDNASLKSHIAMLEKNYGRRAETEIFV